MTVRVGLIGTGVMGTQHAAILARRIAGCELVAVADADHSRARKVAEQYSTKNVFQDPEALVQHIGVDAIVVASSDESHNDLVLACIKAGKPVLCEKPLATTTEQCKQIVDAETAHGKRLVQVGFMRRHDLGYREMRAAVANGHLGQPIFLHCVHRIATAPHYFTTDIIPLASAVHEFDISRFVLNEDFLRVEARRGRPSAQAPSRNPLFFLLQTSSGVLVDIEVFVDAQYGYDVRAELVMETGTVSLPMPAITTVRAAGVDGQHLDPSWGSRFEGAYREQNSEWIASIAGGTAAGASAWDGYMATKLAEASVASLTNGCAVELRLEKSAAIYGP